MATIETKLLTCSLVAAGVILFPSLAGSMSIDAGKSFGNNVVKPYPDPAIMFIASELTREEKREMKTLTRELKALRRDIERRTRKLKRNRSRLKNQ